MAPPPPYDPYGGYPVAPVPMPAPAPLPTPSSYVPVQVGVAGNTNGALLLLLLCWIKTLLFILFMWFLYLLNNFLDCSGSAMEKKKGKKKHYSVI